MNLSETINAAKVRQVGNADLQRAEAAITAFTAKHGIELTGEVREMFVDEWSQGAKTERERCRQILGSRLSEDRPKFAQHLALATDLSADSALEILRNAPAEPKDDPFGF